MNSSKSRNPWPTAIIAFFAVFISGLIAFIIFAVAHRVDLVRSDYYEEEIRFQQQLDRVHRTQQMSESVSVAYDPAQQCITIALPAHLGPTSGRIHLYRPSDARLDTEVPLTLNDQGTQRLDTSRLRAGLWKVRIQWTAAGQEYFFDQSVVLGPPKLS